MGDRPLLVLCATVPWRRAACEAMLSSLARQTVVPDEVILHLDGFARGTPRPRARNRQLRPSTLQPCHAIAPPWRAWSATSRST
jgi:hypothetical protein